MAAASPAEQPSFAVRRTGPADSARPLKELGLRAFALAVKYGASASASDPASLRLAQSTAGTIAGQLQRLAPLALWKDWVPPRAEPSQEVPVGKDSAFASSCKKTDEFAPGKALEDGTTTCWTSGAGKSSFWGVNFGRRVQLSWAAFAFKGTNLPDNVEIEVTDSESAPARADWRAVGRKYAGKDIKGTLNVDFRVPIAARQLRLQFNGSAPGNTDSVVSLSRVRFGEVLGSDSYTPPGTALGQLQAWFAGVAGAGAAGLAVSPASAAAGSVSAEAFEAGIRGLVGLARSSGSLRTLLRLAQALLTAPQRQLSPATAAAGLALLESLRRQAALERTAQSAAEYVPRIPDRPDGDGAASAGGAAGAAGGPKPAVAAPAAASSGASTGPLVDISDVARWDTGCMSAQLDVSEEGKTVRSTDGSYTHCLMRLGATGEKGVTSGRLEWEMKLVSQSHTCGVRRPPASEILADAAARSRSQPLAAAAALFSLSLLQFLLPFVVNANAAAPRSVCVDWSPCRWRTRTRSAPASAPPPSPSPPATTTRPPPSGCTGACSRCAQLRRLARHSCVNMGCSS